MKRIVIADLKSNNNHGVCSGHYYALASNYKDVFCDCCEVKIAGGPIYLKQFKQEDLLLLPHDYINGDSKLKNLFRMISNAWRLFRRVDKDDVVIIQQSQPTMILLALLLTYWGQSNVFQIQYSEEPMRRPLFRIMMKMAHGRIKGLICPNEIVGKAYGVPYVVVPDYIYIEKNNPSLIDTPLAKKYDYAAVGRITSGKGVAEAVTAIANKNCTMIVAGMPQAKSEEKTIKECVSKCKNIEAKLEYICDQDYDFYICSSRYCLLNYQDDYAERSSGVVLDTIFRGVPVVGRRCRALQFIEDNNLGVLYDDVKDFDFSSLLNDRDYAVFLSSIALYKHKIAAFREKLIEFVST